MFGELVRAIPRGTRPPGPTITDQLDGRGNWWGPNAYNTLPWASDGSADPIYMQTGAEAEAAVMGIPGAWRAMNLIAGTIAQMPTSYQKPTDTGLSEFGAEARMGEPVNERLQMLTNPWPLITYYDWLFSCVCSVVLRGNFYAIKFDYDPATGWPRQLLPVHPDDITVEMEDGYPVYTVTILRNGTPYGRKFSWDQMFHVRGFMMPGMIQGIGVVEAHRSGLKAARRLMDFGAGAYASGAVPPVVMKVDKPEITEAEAEYLQSRWVSRHGGLDRRPAVIPKIVDIETVGLSMEDAEYLNSRQFGIAEIAYMFNLDPEDLSAGFSNTSGSLTYQNMETRVRDRIIFSLQCWISRIEQTFSMHVPGDNYVKLNTDELTRSDTLSRMRTYEVGLRNRIWTINEVRHMEGYPPIPGGDDILMNNTNVAIDVDGDNVPDQLQPNQRADDRENQPGPRRAA